MLRIKGVFFYLTAVTLKADFLWGTLTAAGFAKPTRSAKWKLSFAADQLAAAPTYESKYESSWQTGNMRATFEIVVAGSCADQSGYLFKAPREEHLALVKKMVADSGVLNSAWAVTGLQEGSRASGRGGGAQQGVNLANL